MKLHIKDIKKGDTFWEKNAQFEALQDTITTQADFDLPGNPKPMQYSLQAKIICHPYRSAGEVIDFLVTEGAEHYGPRFYTENIYHDTAGY